MCKEELEKIIKKLEDNEDFIKKYDINLRKEYSDSYFIIIKRKLKNKDRSLEEKLVYNPSVSMDYDYKVDVCFKMRYTKGYISNSVSMYATKYVNDDDENYYHFRVRIPNTKSYEQTVIINEINIEDIKIGDEVLTSNGKYYKVTDKFDQGIQKTIKISNK